MTKDATRSQHLFDHAQAQQNPEAQPDSMAGHLWREMGLKVLPITPLIAEQAQHPDFLHGDPADRLIAATTLVHQAPLITADEKLQRVPGLRCVW